jgi:hypothetical protein
MRARVWQRLMGITLREKSPTRARLSAFASPRSQLPGTGNPSCQKLCTVQPASQEPRCNTLRMPSYMNMLGISRAAQGAGMTWPATHRKVVSWSGNQNLL